MMTQMAASNTLLQVLTPDALRGRIMAFYSMMFMGMAPFGALGAGVAAEHLGAPLAVAIGGVASIAGGLAFAWRLPVLREDARAAARRTRGAGRRPARAALRRRGGGAASGLSFTAGTAVAARRRRSVARSHSRKPPTNALRVVAGPRASRQPLQLLDVAAAEHDLVDLEGRRAAAGRSRRPRAASASCPCGPGRACRRTPRRSCRCGTAGARSRAAAGGPRRTSAAPSPVPRPRNSMRPPR